MKSRLLLDVVITQRASILKLLPREDETLLIGRDALLILDLCLDVVNGIRRLNIKGNGLPRQSLNENLHTST